MSSPEAKPSFERCAACPNRAALGRLMARTGLTAVGESCPGPDIVDRFEATSRDSADTREVPKRFKYVGSTFSRGNEETEFFRTSAKRTKVCRQEPIVIGANEVVSKSELNPEGRRWLRIGTGTLEAVRGADFDLDLDRSDSA